MPNPWVSLRHDQLIPVNKVGEQYRTNGKSVGGGGGENKLPPIIQLILFNKLQH
jgi:hypothetical protein